MSAAGNDYANANTLSNFLCNVARETLFLRMTEDVLQISNSLMVPVLHIPAGLLQNIAEFIEEKGDKLSAEFVRAQNKFAICYSRKTGDDSVVGIINLLCAFFMTMAEAHGDVQDVHMGVMDFLIEGALASHNISYDHVYEELTRVGYCRAHSRP